jgi:beta-lactamase regulating signal transducer with metallopeptidase domain
MEMLQQPYVQALASALGHFIWQGAILGLFAYLVIRTGRLGANARYTVGVICLVTMAAMPIATTIYLAHGVAGASSAVRDVPMASGRVAALPIAAADRLASGAAHGWDVRAGVIVSWLVGVMLLSMRLVGGWVMTRRLVDGARGPAAPEIRGLARRVAERLALARLVEVFESPAIAVPMMVGWIKPCVILPTAALSGLTPVQVEALLAHELAHVRRHDYLVNLLQSAIETLLFYHPAVWWISRDVREAREHCCDDIAVAVCDRVVYVSALADLAALARVTAGPRLALAATDGALVGRVRRLLGGADDGRGGRPGWVPAVLLALTVAGMAPIVLSSAPVPETSGLKTMARDAQSREPAKPQTTSPVPGPSGAQTERERAEAAPRLEASGEQGPNRDQIDKLRAMLAELEGNLAEIAGPEQGRTLEALRDQLVAAVDKLKEEQALLERSSETGTKNKEQMREIEAKLAAAANELGDPSELALKKADAEILLQRDALDRADVLKAKRAELDQMKVELALRDQDAEMQTKLSRIETDRLAALQAKLDAAQADGALDPQGVEAKIAEMKARKQMIGAEHLPALAAGERGTPVDSKRLLSLIGPALKAESGEISVVGDVKHPGPIRWEDGLTAAAAMMHAGGPSADNVDIQIGRLAEMNLTWGADGPDSHLRIDGIEPSTTLHAGDVIIVTATKRK